VQTISIKKLGKARLIEKLREKNAGGFLKCIQCGSCTSSCIVNVVDETFNPRMIIGSITRFGRLLSQDPWLCSACLKCVERCPQRVDPFSIMVALRLINYGDYGRLPNRVVEIIRQIKKTGFAFPINEEVREKRRILGLPEFEISEQGLNEIREILSEVEI